MKKNNIWGIALAIILTAIIAGGGVFIWQTNEPSEEELNAEESDVVEEVSSDDELNYQNDYFGFSLTFPESWSGYSVKNEADTISFGFSQQDEIFTISIYTEEEWNELPNNQPNPSYLGENDDLVFASSGSQDSADDFTAQRRSEVSSILDTFATIE